MVIHQATCIMLLTCITNIQCIQYFKWPVFSFLEIRGKAQKFLILVKTEAQPKTEAEPLNYLYAQREEHKSEGKFR